MVDITMCHGVGCKRRDKCYRHTAQQSDLTQSWFTVSPVDRKTGHCDTFWPIKGWEPERSEEESEDGEV